MLPGIPGAPTIDHVGIAVLELDQSVEQYRWLLGAEPSHRELVPEDGLEAVFFEAGPCSVELLASSDPESPVGRFLSRRGPGLHHLAYLVPDLSSELARWAERGAQLIDAVPRPGARGRVVAFVHPGSAGGVLVELCQKSG